MNRYADKVRESLRRRKPYPTYPAGRKDTKPVDSRGWSTAFMFTADYCLKMGYPRRQSARWNPKEERYLIAAYKWGASIQEICDDHQRSAGGIDGRLCKLFPELRAEGQTRHLNSRNTGDSDESANSHRKQVPSSFGRPTRVFPSGMHPQP